MPPGNSFAGQVYSDAAPNTSYQLLNPAPHLANPSAGLDDDLGAAWQRAKIDAIYLAHGTFTGDDAMGLMRELGRLAPRWSQEAKRIGKSWVDHWAGDAGNYTAAYQDQLQRHLTTSSRAIAVRRFHWSGENHHLGRADAAVGLLDELLQRTASGEQQFVLWGHSHAGNVFALMTNLMRSDVAVREKFFAATQTLSPGDGEGTVDVRCWQRVQQQLARPELIQRIRLSIVTFGTPIRYGWETDGFQRLLHFVHHRPVEGLPPYCAAFPFTLEDVARAQGGDYVQQLGIAGTDFLPYLLSRRRWRAQRSLRRLLDGPSPERQLLQRLRLGMRVPTEGETLLVDYPDDVHHTRQQLAGHAIYTRQDWLAFHLQEITRCWF